MRRRIIAQMPYNDLDAVNQLAHQLCLITGEADIHPQQVKLCLREDNTVTMFPVIFVSTFVDSGVMEKEVITLLGSTHKTLGNKEFHFTIEEVV